MMVLNIIEQREIYFDQSHPILLGQSCTPTHDDKEGYFTFSPCSRWTYMIAQLAGV
jgi:hypothetical protein